MTNRQAVNVRKAALLLYFVAVFLKVNAGNDTLQVPDNINCACPGEVLMYTCNTSAPGGGTILWGGSAFDCSSTSNEIRLRLSQFDSPGTSGSCNNNAMRARSVGVVNTDCYISELSVTVSTAFNNRIIRCNHDSGTGERTIGSSTLTVVSAAPDSPSGLRFIDLRDGQIMLSWTPTESTTCVPTIYYRVISNCTTCGSSANNLTTDSCPIPQQWIDSLVCAFRVQSEVCGGNLIGRMSNPAVVTLQEPTLTIIPHYSRNENTVTKIIVLGTNLRIAKSDNTNIFITMYNVTFSDPDTGNVTYSRLFDTCGEDTCETDITPPSNSLSQICPSSTVTVTADYELGQRLLSNPITTGCTNQFVYVQYNSADSTISCTFLNKLDTSIKFCRVTYGSCGQEQMQKTQGTSSSAFPNNVTLSIVPRDSYCYTVTASNGNFTVAVEGTIQSDSGASNVGTIIASAVVASLVGIILIVGSTIVMIIIIKFLILKKGGADDTENVRLADIVPSSIEKTLKLKTIEQRNFKKLEIKGNSKLRAVIVYDSKVFKRGCTYYEFTHEKEYITKDKELIFMNKETGEYLSPNVDRDILYKNDLLGEEVKKPQYKKYKVFVQSTGSGARHLPPKSLLLYEQVQANPWNPKEAPLKPITSSHFITTIVSKGCTVEQFQKENNMKANSCNLFIEYGDTVIKSIRDVILMDKKTKKLFTGPTARSSPKAYLEKYRVFILQYDAAKLKLEAGKTVLHQNPESTMKPFYILEVDEDNVQMAKFVKKKLHEIKFENGRAFYEFTEKEEDLLYYKDIVLMSKTKSPDVKQKEDGMKICDLKSSIRRFYWLSDSVPGVGIKEPKFDEYRVFVQSTSQGSRCLKARTLLLYKV